MSLILDFFESVSQLFRDSCKHAVEMLIIDPVYPVIWIRQGASKLTQALKLVGVLFSEMLRKRRAKSVSRRRGSYSVTF